MLLLLVFFFLLDVYNIMSMSYSSNAVTLKMYKVQYDHVNSLKCYIYYVLGIIKGPQFRNSPVKSAVFYS